MQAVQYAAFRSWHSMAFEHLTAQFQAKPEASWTVAASFTKNAACVCADGKEDKLWPREDPGSSTAKAFHATQCAL